MDVVEKHLFKPKTCNSFVIDEGESCISGHRNMTLFSLKLYRFGASIWKVRCFTMNFKDGERLMGTPGSVEIEKIFFTKFFAKFYFNRLIEKHKNIIVDETRIDKMLKPCN